MRTKLSAPPHHRPTLLAAQRDPSKFACEGYQLWSLHHLAPELSAATAEMPTPLLCAALAFIMRRYKLLAAVFYDLRCSSCCSASRPGRRLHGTEPDAATAVVR